MARRKKAIPIGIENIYNSIIEKDKLQDLNGPAVFCFLSGDNRKMSNKNISKNIDMKPSWSDF